MRKILFFVFKDQPGPLEPTSPYCKSERITMTPEKDGLEYSMYAKCLKDMLYDHNTETPLTVGIYGNWGHGKTSLLELIEQEIQRQEQEIQRQEQEIQRQEQKLEEISGNSSN